MTNLDSMLKNKDIALPTKFHIVKDMVFPLVTHGCENWTTKKAEHQRTDNFWTVVLEKTLENPLDCKEIKPVISKGNQPRIFIHWKDWCWSWSSSTLDTWCKEPNHCKRLWCWERFWRQKEKRVTEDEIEIVGWHHQCNGHEFEKTLGYGEGQGSLACYCPWGWGESDTTCQLNNNNGHIVMMMVQADTGLPNIWKPKIKEYLADSTQWPDKKEGKL